MSARRGNGLARRPAHSSEDLRQIVTHAAFRLGALDALGARGWDCDQIRARVRGETPRRALVVGGPDGWSSPDVELAQRRYEEGRELVIGWGVRFRTWADPRRPPKAVRDWIESIAPPAIVAPAENSYFISKLTAL